jgi:uncharacterized membrane protein HdeD (DUF308 family)
MATATIDRDVDAPEVGPWGFALVAGIAWIILSLVILSFDATSAATIGYLMGLVIIAAGVNEFVHAFAVPGWRWAHGILGVVFLVGGVAALLAPFQTFGILALFIGWYLVFKGAFDVMFSIAAHRELPLWGLLLASGVVQMAIGVWAIGYPGRSAWLLVLWVGIGALMHGVTEIVLAFQIRKLRHAA